MKTTQNSVADLKVAYNSDQNTASILFGDEVLTGFYLRQLMLALGLPYSVMNLPTYTGTDVVSLMLQQVQDRAFMTVRGDDGGLRSFIGLGKGWVTDEQFLHLCDMFENKTGAQKDMALSVLSGAVELKACYKIEDGIQSIGDKSMFSSYFTITRLADGGVSGDASLLRLACTNGMTVPTRFSDHVRISSYADHQKFINKVSLSSKAALINAVDEQMFDAGGRPLMASVREFKTVSKLIDRYTDVPNQFLNREYLDKFYMEKGFPSHIQNFPSGMSFFDVYTTATNAFSNVIKDVPLMEANIELGNILFSKRDASSGIQEVSDVPAFSNTSILRGDSYDVAVSDNRPTASMVSGSKVFAFGAATVEDVVVDVPSVDFSSVDVPSADFSSVDVPSADLLTSPVVVDLDAEAKRLERNKKARERRAAKKGANA